MYSLSIQDQTQKCIARFLSRTEQLLARVAAKLSGGEGDAQIICMPDLGMPHNVTRILGGFFTGALYTWSSRVPFIPVDATVNIDTVSVYRVNGTFADRDDFFNRVMATRCTIESKSSYVWNFDRGNHFITYGIVRGSTVIPDGHYLVIHGSASEFKQQHNGLYPSPRNWYADEVQVMEDGGSGRFIRYIAGRAAESFEAVSRMLVEYNRSRHRYVATQLVGERNVLDEVLSVPHYGMPTIDSIAIGCQWLRLGERFLLLTRPGEPMAFIEAAGGTRNRSSGLPDTWLYPHGLGKASSVPLSIQLAREWLFLNGVRYHKGQSLAGDTSLSLRELGDGNMSPELWGQSVQRFLGDCHGRLIARLDPLFCYKSP